MGCLRKARMLKTFDLKLPVAEGAYAGVDPKGTTITWRHQHSSQRERAVQAAAERLALAKSEGAVKRSRPFA
jgi:hypothetical protein